MRIEALCLLGLTLRPQDDVDKVAESLYSTIPRGEDDIAYYRGMIKDFQVSPSLVSIDGANASFASTTLCPGEPTGCSINVAETLLFFPIGFHYPLKRVAPCFTNSPLHEQVSFRRNISFTWPKSFDDAPNNSAHADPAKTSLSYPISTPSPQPPLCTLPCEKT